MTLDQLLMRGFISGYELSKLSQEDQKAAHAYLIKHKWFLKNGDGWFAPAYWEGRE